MRTKKAERTLRFTLAVIAALERMKAKKERYA